MHEDARDFDHRDAIAKSEGRATIAKPDFCQIVDQDSGAGRPRGMGDIVR